MAYNAGRGPPLGGDGGGYYTHQGGPSRVDDASSSSSSAPALYSRQQQPQQHQQQQQQHSSLLQPNPHPHSHHLPRAHSQQQQQQQQQMPAWISNDGAGPGPAMIGSSSSTGASGSSSSSSPLGPTRPSLHQRHSSSSLSNHSSSAGAGAYSGSGGGGGGGGVDQRLKLQPQQQSQSLQLPSFPPPPPQYLYASQGGYRSPMYESAPSGGGGYFGGNSGGGGSYDLGPSSDGGAGGGIIAQQQQQQQQQQQRQSHPGQQQQQEGVYQYHQAAVTSSSSSSHYRHQAHHGNTNSAAPGTAVPTPATGRVVHLGTPAAAAAPETRRSTTTGAGPSVAAAAALPLPAGTQGVIGQTTLNGSSSLASSTTASGHSGPGDAGMPGGTRQTKAGAPGSAAGSAPAAAVVTPIHSMLSIQSQAFPFFSTSPSDNSANTPGSTSASSTAHNPSASSSTPLAPPQPPSNAVAAGQPPSDPAAASGNTGAAGMPPPPLPEYVEMNNAPWLLQSSGFQLNLPDLTTAGTTATGRSPLDGGSTLHNNAHDSGASSSGLPLANTNANGLVAASSSTHLPRQSASLQQTFPSFSLPTHIPSQPLPLPAPLNPPAPVNVPPSDPLFFDSDDLSSWRLAVDPFQFSSGLEGISGLPLEVYHATSALGQAPPPPPAVDMRRMNEWAPSYETQVDQLDKYLNELISLMEPFSATPSNPSPAPPPPYLHTRLARLATLVRETLATLETSSQPALSIEFLRLPPGNEPPTGEDMTEAEREMELIRRRREVLNTKAQQGKRVGGTPVPPRPPGPAPLAPRPNRDVWRCHGCGTTVCDEWRDGPDGPQSLCVNCGYHYDRLVRKREGGDPDFSTVPAPGYNPDLLGSLSGL